jgi:hypothetical protein
MSQRKRLFAYILLNIFISASVTGGLLFWYDRTYRQALIPSAPLAVVSGGDATPSGSTFDPQEDIAVEIVSVIGAQTLDTEMVLVRYNGATELDLTNWRLKDEDKNIFVFPQLTLYPNGAVQVHTTSGKNTVVDLYWGLSKAVWDSGETVTLLDPQDTPRATYQVP